MRFFFHFAMSRRDWIRNTRRERIVYIPVEGDGSATNLIAIRKIGLGNAIMRLSDLSTGTGQSVSVPAGQSYLHIYKDSGQTNWTFYLFRGRNNTSFQPFTGSFYAVGSWTNFSLYGDDESTPIITLFSNQNTSTDNTFESFFTYFYLSSFQFHFEADE